MHDCKLNLEEGQNKTAYNLLKNTNRLVIVCVCVHLCHSLSSLIAGLKELLVVHAHTRINLQARSSFRSECLLSSDRPVI